MAGALTLSGMAAGLMSGSKVVGPNTMTGAVIVGGISDVVLATGDNTFVVPAGAVGVAIFLASANVSAIKIRTNLNPTDAGLPVNPSGPWLAWPLMSGTTSVIINDASGGTAIELTFI